MCLWKEKKIFNETFIFPSIEKERGEIERVAHLFSTANTDEFVSKFIEVAQVSELKPISEEEWLKLENTDSIDISNGDWEGVRKNAESVKRDWETLKTKIESGENLDAPIILKIGETLHLVSGNTRLMISRALGIVPKILMVNM